MLNFVKQEQAQKDTHQTSLSSHHGSSHETHSDCFKPKDTIDQAKQSNNFNIIHIDGHKWVDNTDQPNGSSPDSLTLRCTVYTTQHTDT